MDVATACLDKCYVVGKPVSIYQSMLNVLSFYIEITRSYLLSSVCRLPNMSELIPEVVEKKLKFVFKKIGEIR